MYVCVRVCTCVYVLCMLIYVWNVLQLPYIMYSQAFLGAVFDTLLYQLTDSLQRLTNVKKIEVSKEDSKSFVLLEYYCYQFAMLKI